MQILITCACKDLKQRSRKWTNQINSSKCIRFLRDRSSEITTFCLGKRAATVLLRIAVTLSLRNVRFPNISI